LPRGIAGEEERETRLSFQERKKKIFVIRYYQQGSPVRKRPNSNI
jgi:hypothetical protein